MKERIFKTALFCAAAVVLLLIAGMLYTLILQSLPVFRHSGVIQFIISQEWNPEKEGGTYGGGLLIAGTFLTASTALLVSIPFSISIALFIGAYYKEKPIAYWVMTIIDICGRIPSIIFGIWGYFTLRPLFMLLNIGDDGFSILLAALVLALMLIPYSSAVTAYFIRRTPQSIQEGAYCLGATHTEVVWKICLPYAKKGIIAAFILSLGKALGETIIVAILIGNNYLIPSQITRSGSSITNMILRRFGTTHELEMSALFALALLLFLFTFGMNLIARRLIRRATA
ncbi:MAG: phosphate ABC transporter permease subunit PstC [Candidatus Azobacteroides sp.]|nr:phosphate ABC transporter permease subunit PstC [Candidatus Azobacteroides sp.]